MSAGAGATSCGVAIVANAHGGRLALDRLTPFISWAAFIALLGPAWQTLATTLRPRANASRTFDQLLRKSGALRASVTSPGLANAACRTESRKVSDCPNSYLNAYPIDYQGAGRVARGVAGRVHRKPPRILRLAAPSEMWARNRSITSG